MNTPEAKPLATLRMRSRRERCWQAFSAAYRYGFLTDNPLHGTVRPHYENYENDSLR